MAAVRVCESCLTFIVYRLTHTSYLTSSASCVTVRLQCFCSSLVCLHTCCLTAAEAAASPKRLCVCVCLLTAAIFALRHLVTVTIVTRQRFLTLASSPSQHLNPLFFWYSLLQLRASRFHCCSFHLPALQLIFALQTDSVFFFLLLKSVWFYCLVLSWPEVPSGCVLKWPY